MSGEPERLQADQGEEATRSGQAASGDAPAEDSRQNASPGASGEDSPAGKKPPEDEEREQTGAIGADDPVSAPDDPPEQQPAAPEEAAEAPEPPPPAAAGPPPALPNPQPPPEILKATEDEEAEERREEPSAASETALAPPPQEPPAAPPPPAGEAAAAAAVPRPGVAPFMPGLPNPGQPLPAGAAEEDAEIEEASYEELMAEYAPEETPELHEGDRRTGVVVGAVPEGVVVDIGAKTEGLLSERDQDQRTDLSKLEPGQEIEVVVLSMAEPGEYVRLGLPRIENLEAWEALEEAFRERRPVNAKVVERVKGGLTVEIGLPAFLPGSQTALRPVQDLDTLIGEEFPVRIVKLSRRRGNIVVSRRELLEEEINAVKRETLAKIELGALVTGVVKNVTSYGAFVDLGGIDGLIHVTDISYGRVKDPSQALKPGQEVTAKVIKFDREKERVSLSLKETEPDPWDGVEERFQPGMKVKGTVASVTDYGAFVELEPGVEGLIHITEMTWSKRLKHPSKVIKEGEEVEAAVLNVQRSDRRISLSLKQLRPDPWESAEAKYQTGAVVEGRVRNVTSYGAFVELEEGVDGLVHVSDLSWDTRVKEPRDAVKKGQMLRAVVLGVDLAQRRMSLGVKQLEPDAWETFASNHGVGEIVQGLAVRQAKFGVFVELAPGIEGLCHNSQIPARGGRGRGNPLETGKRYEFEIIKLDEADKRIGLRCMNLTPLEDRGTAPDEA